MFNILLTLDIILFVSIGGFTIFELFNPKYRKTTDTIITTLMVEMGIIFVVSFILSLLSKL